MKSLRELNLYECGLRRVPAFVGELKSLECLDLSCNYTLQIDASTLDLLLEGCPRLRKVSVPGYDWTPESRAHLKAFKAKLHAKNPDAKVCRLEVCSLTERQSRLLFFTSCVCVFCFLFTQCGAREKEFFLLFCLARGGECRKRKEKRERRVFFVFFVSFFSTPHSLFSRFCVFMSILSLAILFLSLQSLSLCVDVGTVCLLSRSKKEIPNFSFSLFKRQPSSFPPPPLLRTRRRRARRRSRSSRGSAASTLAATAPTLSSKRRVLFPFSLALSRSETRARRASEAPALAEASDAASASRVLGAQPRLEGPPAAAPRPALAAASFDPGVAIRGEPAREDGGKRSAAPALSAPRARAARKRTHCSSANRSRSSAVASARARRALASA